jgi:hypothetical protein
VLKPFPDLFSERAQHAVSASAREHVVANGSAIDWSNWLRETERKRRLLSRAESGIHGAPVFWTANYYARATLTSFELEGMPLSRADLTSALQRCAACKACRSRQQQRGRNHVAILRRLEKFLRFGTAIKAREIVRWYTSIASGLSTTRLDEPSMRRIDEIARQINSPHLRLCPALQGIARLHAELLADPIVPSFNGILARLLLRYQLGRCGLPPVLFAPDRDGASVLLNERKFLPRLLKLIDAAFGEVLGDGNQ